MNEEEFTFKTPSGMRMSQAELRGIPHNRLADMYEEKAIVLFDLVAWKQLGYDLRTFPFDKYGFPASKIDDYMLSIGEAMASMESLHSEMEEDKNVKAEAENPI